LSPYFSAVALIIGFSESSQSCAVSVKQKVLWEYYFLVGRNQYLGQYRSVASRHKKFAVALGIALGFRH
jgi:hypothetical protein